MKRNSIRRAYEPVCPDEEARSRMLTNILLSSEISPRGREKTVNRRKMKIFAIAAMTALMLLLMGCAVIALGIQDLRIGQWTTRGEILDSEGNVLVEKECVTDVLSLHGLVNSPAFLAHQEWYEFYKEYSRNHVMTEEENFFVPPEAYEAYSAYNQELMDKIDEIAGKYGLKLLGGFAPFQQWESGVFHEATGVDSLLMPDSTAVIESESGYFYEGGNFKVTFRMDMPDVWPHTMLNTMYYSKSDCFDTVTFGLHQTEGLQQWNYTAASGAELLIVQPRSAEYALIFCPQPDALIYMQLETCYTDNSGATTLMTKRQLEQAADQFNYFLSVKSVDMELAKAKLEKYNHSNYLQESTAAYTSFADYIRARIEALGDDASCRYYSLADINTDGTDDLIVGTESEIEAVWMLKYGQMNLVMEYGENYRKLKEAWPAMEKTPITEYLSE